MDDNYLGWSALIAPVIMGNADRPELGDGADQLVLPHGPGDRPAVRPDHVPVGQPRRPRAGRHAGAGAAVPRGRRSHRRGRPVRARAPAGQRAGAAGRRRALPQPQRARRGGRRPSRRTWPVSAPGRRRLGRRPRRAAAARRGRHDPRRQPGAARLGRPARAGPAPEPTCSPWAGASTGRRTCRRCCTCRAGSTRSRSSCAARTAACPCSCRPSCTRPPTAGDASTWRCPGRPSGRGTSASCSRRGTAADRSADQLRALQATTAALSQGVGTDGVVRALVDTAVSHLGRRGVRWVAAEDGTLVRRARPAGAGRRAPRSAPTGPRTSSRRTPSSARRRASWSCGLGPADAPRGTLVLSPRDDAFDVGVLTAVGQQAGLALERARLFDQKASVAHELQHALLTPTSGRRPVHRDHRVPPGVRRSRSAATGTTRSSLDDDVLAVVGRRRRRRACTPPPRWVSCAARSVPPPGRGRSGRPAHAAGPVREPRRPSASWRRSPTPRSTWDRARPVRVRGPPAAAAAHGRRRARVPLGGPVHALGVGAGPDRGGRRPRPGGPPRALHGRPRGAS